MENINLKQFVESLNSSYDQYSITKIDLPQRFNLKLEKKDFEHLNSTLQNEYGLLLKMDKMKTEYIEINFDEHDEKDT